MCASLHETLPDPEMDRQAEVNGFVTSLGRTRATWLCWILLAAGSAILAAESYSASAWFPVVIALALVSAAIYARFSKKRTAVFTAILALVVVQVLVLLAAVSVG